jgi:hypothetical protein
LEVAESLAARNGLAIRHGLAIWERYLRAGLVSCLGLPTVVVDHAALLADPVGAATDLSRFLADDVAPSDAVATAAATIDPDLRHHAAAGTDEVSDEQLALWQQLRQLVGAHPRLATAPAGAETPGLDAYLAPRRSFWGWSPSARLSADPVLGLVAAYSAEGA